MTPIRKGTAAKLGLRKPEPSLAKKIASFVRLHMPEYALDPWQVYVMDEWDRRRNHP